MRRLTIAATFSAAALMGLLTVSADAQTWRHGALAIDTANKNYTPIEKVACYGWGPRCGPGWTWVCNRWGYCRCRPCF